MWVATLAAADTRLDVPFFRQEKNGCGAASVAMVLDYWTAQHPSLQLPRPRVYDRLRVTDTQGVALADLRQYFVELGFHAYTLRANWADFEDHLSKGRPVIACVKTGSNDVLHYVVVVGLDSKRVWINDPARRKTQSLDRAKFDKQWLPADRWILLAVPRKGQ